MTFYSYKYIADSYTCELLSPLNPKSDYDLISSYNITLELHIKVMRIKEMITNYKSFWLFLRFSLQHLKKCMESSMEIMNTDVWV